MHEVQAVATRLKPILFRSFCSPAASRLSVTTCEPGPATSFTHGLALRPCLTALRAISPAPQHYVGVRGIGAGGDCRDHHVAMARS